MLSGRAHIDGVLVKYMSIYIIKYHCSKYNSYGGGLINSMVLGIQINGEINFNINILGGCIFDNLGTVWPSEYKSIVNKQA